MEKAVHLLIVSLLFFSLSCTHPAENLDNNDGETSKPNQIVLIFHEPPVNNQFQFDKRIVLRNHSDHEIEYVDDHSIIRYLNLKYAPESDTVVIRIQKEVQEVQLAYRGSDKLTYLFQSGDSVLFTYNGLIPTAKVLNRKTRMHDINYDAIKRELFYSSDDAEFIDLEDIPATVRYYDLPNLYREDMNGLDAVRLRSRKIRQEAKEEREREMRFLDSLKQLDLISNDIYHYYKAKNWYEVEKLLPIVPRKESRKEGDIISGTLYQSLMQHRSDTLLQYGFYHDFLSRIGTNYFETKADRVESTNGWHYDYRQVYDTILHNKILHKRDKEILLAKYLEKIIKNSSVKQIATYLDKFKTDVKDTALVNYAIATYNLNFDQSNELQLQTLDAQVLNFEKVLEQLEGKLVYVDFWASWCRPCIEAMPASHLLQEEYQGKNVAFIYLSLDEKMERWKKGTEKNKILKNSYLVRNQYTSQMMDVLKIQSIPRYLLYDEQGSLIHRNAPGPGSEQIRKLLDQFLSENMKK